MDRIAVFNGSGYPEGYGNFELPPKRWAESPVRLLDAIRQTPRMVVDGPEVREAMGFPGSNEPVGEVMPLGWSSPLHYADGYGSIAQEIADCLLTEEFELHQPAPGEPKRDRPWWHLRARVKAEAKEDETPTGTRIALTIAPRDYDPSNTRFGGLPLERWEDEAFVPHSIVSRLIEQRDTRSRSGDWTDHTTAYYGINMTWPRESYLHPFVRGISLTMFETTRLAAGWAECLNRCRRIIVPCDQNKQAFEDSGVTSPIEVVPLGVVPEKWPVPFRSADCGVRNREQFTFLMAGGLTLRKNPLCAARAFAAAFPNNPDVRLIFKTRGAITSPGFREWARDLPRDDRIQVVFEESTPQRMAAYFHEADCFVFPSRGEGFGLPPLAAMCTGLPTIVSNNSGMSMYANPRYCYPIPCEEVKVPDHDHGGFPRAWGDVGNWWEPDLDAFVEIMRHVYRDRDKAAKKGARAAQWVRDNWTVRQTCEKLLGVVMKDAGETDQG